MLAQKVYEIGQGRSNIGNRSFIEPRGLRGIIPGSCMIG